MRKLFLFAIFVCITVSVSFAQNKKSEKEAVAKAKFEKAVAAIEAKDFVVIVDSYEADDKTITTNADVIITASKGSNRRFSGEIVPSTESKYFKRPGV